MKAITSIVRATSFKQKRTAFKSTGLQRGVTAVELIIGLAVIGLVIAGVAVTAQSTFRDQKINDEAQRVQMLHSKLRAFVATSPNTDDAKTANVITAKMVPADAVSGTTILSKFGYPISVVPTKVVSASSNDAIQLIYSNLTTEECINFTKAVGGSFHNVGISTATTATTTTAVAPATGDPKYNGGQLSDSVLLTKCDGGKKDVVLTMLKN
jgi:type II secretory pathway pseudopilin PulG